VSESDRGRVAASKAIIEMHVVRVILRRGPREGAKALMASCRSVLGEELNSMKRGD